MTSDEYNKMRLYELQTGISIREQLSRNTTQVNAQISDAELSITDIRRKNRHEEDDLQKKCVAYFNKYHDKYRLLLNHCPCETKRDAKIGAKLKEMGMRAGYPDLVLHLPRHKYGCLGIELKTIDGRQSENQKEMQMIWESSGNMYCIIRSYEQFVTLVEWWIYGDGTPLNLPVAEKARIPKLIGKKTNKKRTLGKKIAR